MLLLDTHAFLWFVRGDLQLSLNARLAIENPASEKWVSIASAWEVAIKVSTGKLTLTQTTAAFFAEQMARNGFDLLPLELQHLTLLETLTFHHRDPFDRLLIAQAATQGLTLVSADTTFDKYGIHRLW